MPPVIAGNTAVRQNAGVTILTGANTYTGPTSIKGGTLRAGKDSALGTGAIGLSGGTLDLGGADALTLTLGTGANVVMSAGTLAMNILSPSSYDRISGHGGKFTITGGILDLTGSTLTVGSYQIFTEFDAASSGSFTSIQGYNISSMPPPSVSQAASARSALSPCRSRKRRPWRFQLCLE